jgi:hypothetical protein
MRIQQMFMYRSITKLDFYRRGCLRAAVLFLSAAPALLQAQQWSAIAPVHPIVLASDVAAVEAGQQNVSYCSLNGRVTSPEGDPLPGAKVQLSAALVPTREAESDADGHFAIVDLPPGTFTVKVSRDGFTAISGSVKLAPEANTATATFTLHPTASDSVSVTASAKDIAQAQLEMAEQQRVAGILPNFFVSYMYRAVPLTSRQKFRLAFKNASDPGNLLLVGVVAGVQQADNAFPGYGQGAKGYGRRYGADLGNLVSGTFLGGANYPSLFHQDPRYFYRGTGTFRKRFLYAVTRTVVTRGDNGRHQFNYSTVLGDMSAGALSNLYYAPEDRRGAKVTVVNGLLGIAGDAMNNVFQEFVLKKLTTNSKRNTIKK